MQIQTCLGIRSHWIYSSVSSDVILAIVVSENNTPWSNRLTQWEGFSVCINCLDLDMSSDSARIFVDLKWLFFRSKQEANHNTVVAGVILNCYKCGPRKWYDELYWRDHLMK